MTNEDYPEDETEPKPFDQPAVESGEQPDEQPDEQPEDPLDDEQPEDDSADLKPGDQLQAIVDAAKSARLSPADEDRAVELLKQTIPGGPKALPAALDAILSLSWAVGVKAVTEAWPETKPAGRARLLKGLAEMDSDASRRIRLSLARGLHAQDAASAFKLILGVCEAMGGAQGGSTTKDRQIFANVMLGKARPWIMNIPITEMKPAEAHKLITPALESCAQAPIFTQIWVLRWICDADKFDTLPPEHIESIGKSINRWQPRWRKELRKIIPKLPDSLEAALGDSHVRPAPSAAEAPAADAGRFPAAGHEPEEDDEEEEEAAEPPPEEPRQPPPQRAENHPSRSSRDRQQPASFDLARSLREIDGYVSRLRTELQQAQAAARRREPAPGRARGRAQQPPASGEEVEELRRHNLQLEDQNQELRQRIEELTSDHEDRAATIEIHDALEQFKTFLGLKLKEDFADYTAISRESLNEVVRRHAHEILGRIFSVLQGEGIRFDRRD